MRPDTSGKIRTTDLAACVVCRHPPTATRHTGRRDAVFMMTDAGGAKAWPHPAQRRRAGTDRHRRCRTAAADRCDSVPGVTRLRPKGRTAALLDAESPKSSPCPASLSCQPDRRNGQPFRKFCQPTRKNGKPTRFSRQPARRTRRCDTITATLVRASRTDTDDRRFPIRANGKLRPRHEGRFAGTQC